MFSNSFLAVKPRLIQQFINLDSLPQHNPLLTNPNKFYRIKDYLNEIRKSRIAYHRAANAIKSLQILARKMHSNEISLSAILKQYEKLLCEHKEMIALLKELLSLEKTFWFNRKKISALTRDLNESEQEQREEFSKYNERLLKLDEQKHERKVAEILIDKLELIIAKKKLELTQLLNAKNTIIKNELLAQKLIQELNIKTTTYFEELTQELATYHNKPVQSFTDFATTIVTSDTYSSEAISLAKKVLRTYDILALIENDKKSFRQRLLDVRLYTDDPQVAEDLNTFRGNWFWRNLMILLSQFGFKSKGEKLGIFFQEKYKIIEEEKLLAMRGFNCHSRI